MATTLKQPTDRRGGGKLAAPFHRLSRRERIAALALAVVLLLLLAVGVGSAVGGGLPFLGGDEEARGGSGVPSDWADLEPLLPLAPSLKDMAALKSTAAGGDSGVLASESGTGGGGGGALRVRALPDPGAAPGGGTRVAVAQAPSGRPRPTSVGAPAPAVVRVPLVRRIIATRLRIGVGIPNDLRRIIEDDLRNLTGLPIDFNLGSLRGTGGRGPVTLTVVDSQADSRFDILLVARGGRLIEAYRFRDRDIAGLAAQINVRSGVLVADLLRNGRRLARVTAAPLRPDPAGTGSGLLGSGLAAGASRGGAGIGAIPASLASARSGAQGRQGARARRGGRRSAGRSGGGGRSSPSFSPGSSPSSGAGRSTPRPRASSRRSTAPRRPKPARPRRSSHKHKPKYRPQRGGKRPKPSWPRRGGGGGGGDDDDGDDDDGGDDD